MKLFTKLEPPAKCSFTCNRCGCNTTIPQDKLNVFVIYDEDLVIKNRQMMEERLLSFKDESTTGEAKIFPEPLTEKFYFFVCPACLDRNYIY